MNRLRQRLKGHNSRGRQPYRLDLSVGFAPYDPENPSALDGLMAEADRAMYKEKKSRRR